MKHFKLTTTTKQFAGRTLYQIEATIDSLHARKGELGGWVENETNLSGQAWVYDNALVYGSAQVSGSAQVYGGAQVYGEAKVTKYGECIVINNLKNTITVMPNLITIGCKSYKNLEDFMGRYKQDGAENGYSAKELKITKNLIENCLELMGKTSKKTAKTTKKKKRAKK